ncbi:charged multivesicular body protein 1a-like [Penaeus chinensis]|uniref:charged multivesicular body protein 1a-like n=1 Tax=Penaeus chinensis TaxID=139456 RepID=UPI001FB85C2C|nr:charged multivesicular body protein 1a-like [Penaeus chinensis]
MPWFGEDPQKKMMDCMFELKMCEKQMERLSKKAEKEQMAQKKKMVTAMKQGNVEGARIYAENCIRKKQESLSYLRMASRLDGVKSRVQSAMAMQGVTKNMSGAVGSLDKALKAMDLEKISHVMGQFESQFEDLDVRTNVMEDSMAAATTLSTPKSDVDALIQQVAEEAGLDMVSALPEMDSVGELSTVGEKTKAKEMDELDQRLASLRN